MKKIVFFTGNRAEFGILNPLIFSLYKNYKISIVISGAHTNTETNSKNEIYEILSDYCEIKTYEFLYSAEDFYRDNFKVNFEKGYDLLNKLKPDLSIVLGDRVETYAFANASFFNNIPICHLFGGDIGNGPYFDTNIRHAISKIANLHFASNRQSYENLLRMGEESWRCFNMGNISLDNYTLGNVSKKENILTKYSLKDKMTVLFTYHPSQFISASENFKNFFVVYNRIKRVAQQIVITFPNNDQGHEEITSFLEEQPSEIDNVYIVKNLGIRDYLGMLKEIDCIVVGNSSSGLFETAFTGTPSINVGDRQTDRPRASNVIDISIGEIETLLENTLKDIIKNYSKIKENNRQDYDFFGVGNSVKIVLDGIELFLRKEKIEQISKKFIIHNKFE